MKNKFRIAECYKPTMDDWCPSYNINGLDAVKVMFIILIDGGYRVAVWGRDDYGMEKDFDKNSYEDARWTFDRLVSEDYVNQNFLTEFGFSMA